MPDWSTLTTQLALATGRPFQVSDYWPVAGGCINSAVILEGAGQRYFVKYNRPAYLHLFAAEAEGLTELGRSGAVRVPATICWGASEEMAFLALEYLDLFPAGPTAQERLGRQLACLHRVRRPHFGWDRANSIGATPQLNTPATDWIDFFRDRRLGYQLRLAAKNGYGRLTPKGERLLMCLEAFFRGYTVQPSLLHGDLWSGNIAQTDSGEPTIFDPAVYFGDREADLAMTELFGGFADAFYAAYREEWPLAAGYEVRRTLYNLYHVLNHLNLFGGGYLAQSERMIDELLAEFG